MKALLRTPAPYLMLALGAILVYFASATPYFGTVANLKGIVAAAAVTGVAALGVTVAASAGSIDFSIAGTIALTTMIFGSLQDVPIVLALLACLAAAIAVGVVNGGAVGIVGVDPFIGTLAVGGTLRGIAFLMSGENASVALDESLITRLGQGELLGTPVPAIVLVLVAAVAAIALRYTAGARALLAAGGDPSAARLAGISVRRARVAGYVISALCGAIAGLLLAGRTGAGLPTAASGQELLIFSAVILGGTNLRGGTANIGGTLAAVLLVNALYNGFVLSSVSPYWQVVLQGAFLIIAVAVLQRERKTVETRELRPEASPA